MDEARRTRWCAALLVVVVVMTAVESATGAVFLCWPVSGFAAGAAVLCPRRRRWLLGLGLALAVGVAIPLADGVADVLVPLLGGVAPAVLAGLVVGRGGRTAIDEPAARIRYGVSLLAVGVGSGAVTATLLLPGRELLDAGALGLAAGLAAIAATQVALALLLPRGTDAPLAGPVELWCVRSCLAAGTAAVVLADLDVVLFLVLAVFGWAAARMARHEAVVHLCSFSVIAYVGAFTPLGLLTPPTQDPGSALAPTLVVAYLVGCGFLVVPLATAMERLKSALAREVHLADTNRRLFDAPTSTMVVTTDEHGRITSFNRGAETVMGWSASEVIGRSPTLFHPPDTVAVVARRLGCSPDFSAVSLAQMGAGTTEPWEYVGKDGRRGVVRLAIHPMLDPTTGDVIGSFAVGDDLTEQERTRTALDAALRQEQVSRERLREADDLKQGLVATLSHELRTPVTSMRGYAEMIGDGTLGDVSALQRDAVERILRNADRLTDLVEDLLALNGTRGGGDVAGRTVDLGDLAQEVVDRHRSGRQGAGRHLRADRGPGTLLVLGDPEDLRHVVSNLVSNALKFTPETGEVVVRTHGAGGTVVLTVSDTGVGIAPEDQALLFQRFFRTRSATESAVQGTGVGLSTVRALVTALGGEVELSSELGRGTTVVVTLPLGAETSGERDDQDDGGRGRTGQEDQRPHAGRGEAVAQHS